LQFAEVGLGERFETGLEPPAPFVGGDQCEAAAVERNAVADPRRCARNNTRMGTQTPGTSFRTDLNDGGQTFNQTSEHGQPSITPPPSFAQVSGGGSPVGVRDDERLRTGDS